MSLTEIKLLLVNLTDFPELRRVCSYTEYTQKPPSGPRRACSGDAIAGQGTPERRLQPWWPSHETGPESSEPGSLHSSVIPLDSQTRPSASSTSRWGRLDKHCSRPSRCCQDRFVCLSTSRSSKFFDSDNWRLRTSLVGQWLGLHTLTAEGVGSIPSRGTKSPQAARHSQTNTKTHWRPASHLCCWWSTDRSEELEAAVPEKGSTFRVKTPSNDHGKAQKTRSSRRQWGLKQFRTPLT